MSGAVAIGATTAVSGARAWATVACLVSGVLFGIVAHVATDQRPASSPYPSQPKTDEPQVAHDVAAAVLADDARSLSAQLSAGALRQLGAALQPLADIRKVKFVGAVEEQRFIVSAYVAQGKTMEGIDLVVGFVVVVRDDQVVGIR